MQRSIGQTASSATYPAAALYNDNICAYKTKAGIHLAARTHNSFIYQLLSLSGNPTNIYLNQHLDYEILVNSGISCARGQDDNGWHF